MISLHSNAKDTMRQSIKSCTNEIYVDTVQFVCAVDEQDVMYLVREWWVYVKTKSLVNI
jgi:hypothetical protein